MIQIIYNRKTKKALFCPLKTASSSLQESVGGLLPFIDLSSLNPNVWLWLQHYEIASLVRDPVDWYVSGYRYSHQNINLKHRSDTFYNHLQDVKTVLENDNPNPFPKNKIFHLTWINHCVKNPIMQLKSIGLNATHFIKIENNLKKQVCDWLDTDLPLKHLNCSVGLDFPIIGDNECKLLQELSSTWAETAGYNIETSIEQYKAKVNTL